MSSLNDHPWFIADLVQKRANLPSRVLCTEPRIDQASFTARALVPNWFQIKLLSCGWGTLHPERLAHGRVPR